MNKITKTILIGSSLFILIGCKPEERSREDTPEDPVVVDKTIAELKEDEYKLIPSYMVTRISTYDSYEAITTGETVSSVLFINVTQKIDVTVIKDKDYSYMMNKSASDMYKSQHESYYHNKETLSQNDDESDFVLRSFNDYLNIYGTCPFDNALEGYTLNEESILKVEKLESETDYKFKVTFDKDKATNNVKIQMKKFGKLDDYPKFEMDTEMTITLKNDFTPISLVLHTQYKAKKVVETPCTQNYTVNYSKFNESVEIPKLNEMKDKFSK